MKRVLLWAALVALWLAGIVGIAALTMLMDAPPGFGGSLGMLLGGGLFLVALRWKLFEGKQPHHNGPRGAA